MPGRCDEDILPESNVLHKQMKRFREPPKNVKKGVTGRNQEHTAFHMTSKSNLEISEFQKQPDGINEAFAAAGTPIMSHTSVNLECEA